MVAGRPEEIALRFGGAVHNDNPLVHTSQDLAERVRRILEQHQPHAAEEREAGAGTTNAQAAVMPTAARSAEHSGRPKKGVGAREYCRSHETTP